MQWKNNNFKDKDYPTYVSAVKSIGNKNIDEDDIFTVNEQKQQTLMDFFAKHGNVNINSYHNPHDDK